MISEALPNTLARILASEDKHAYRMPSSTLSRFVPKTQSETFLVIVIAHASTSRAQASESNMLGVTRKDEIKKKCTASSIRARIKLQSGNIFMALLETYSVVLYPPPSC